MTSTDASRIKPLVLVVSEDPRIRDEASLGLAPDVDIAFARDARDAWTSLTQAIPALVIVDMETGNSGAFALARDMAQSYDLATVPVFILLERDQDAWLARQAGAAGYRKKPLTADDLAREVGRILT